MAVLNDIAISVTAQEVLLAQYLGRRTTFTPAVIESAEQAIARGKGLWAPAAGTRELAVQGIEGQELLLAGGARLHIGPKIDLLEPAERVLVSVDTIGPALEKEVERLNARGEILDAYMLDSVGVVALGSVGDALREMAERRAAELGWGVGAALSPGSLVGWPLRGQRELCALLPLETIGVRLSAHYVLEPHKSASMLIGLGPTYPSTRVGSVCRFCSLAETCWRRKH